MMCLQAVEWATEKQRACAKSCNILMLLSASEYLGLRKGHVVWSLGHFKHKGKKCISEKDSQGLGLEERPHWNNTTVFSGGLRCISLETKGKHPRAKGLRQDKGWLKEPSFLHCPKPIKTSPATSSALDHSFISLDGLAGRMKFLQIVSVFIGYLMKIGKFDR